MPFGDYYFEHPFSCNFMPLIRMIASTVGTDWSNAKRKASLFDVVDDSSALAKIANGSLNGGNSMKPSINKWRIWNIFLSRSLATYLSLLELHEMLLLHLLLAGSGKRHGGIIFIHLHLIRMTGLVYDELTRFDYIGY